MTLIVQQNIGRGNILLFVLSFVTISIQRRVPFQAYLEVFGPLEGFFFVRDATHGKVMTSDSLQKRGKILVNMCHICVKGI